MLYTGHNIRRSLEQNFQGFITFDSRTFQPLTVNIMYIRMIFSFSQHFLIFRLHFPFPTPYCSRKSAHVHDMYQPLRFGAWI